MATNVIEKTSWLWEHGLEVNRDGAVRIVWAYDAGDYPTSYGDMVRRRDAFNQAARHIGVQDTHRARMVRRRRTVKTITTLGPAEEDK